MGRVGEGAKRRTGETGAKPGETAKGRFSGRARVPARFKGEVKAQDLANLGFGKRVPVTTDREDAIPPHRRHADTPNAKRQTPNAKRPGGTPRATPSLVRFSLGPGYCMCRCPGPRSL